MAEDWRNTGDLPQTAYEVEFSRMGSPLLEKVSAIWAAARPHSAIALGKLFVEQKYATLSQIPRSFHNPLSLAKPDGIPADGDDRWERYPSDAAGVAAWKARITSPTYKNGVYARTVTLADLIAVYAPPHDNNDPARYEREVRERIAAYREDTSVPELNMTKGLIPLPGFNDEAGTFTKYENVGCNYLGPRQIDVLFFHRALGYGARGVADWLKRSDVQGLTDWVIDPVTAYMIRLVDIKANNPPTGWAQGPYRKPVPDLQKMVARWGIGADAINRHGESIEVAGMYGDPISAACKRDLAQWTASRAHDRGIAWDRFPLTPEGYSFIYGHVEACGADYKICPGPVVWAFINDGELIEMVRGILKTVQTGGVVDAPVKNDPKPAPVPKEYAKPRPIRGLAKLTLDDLDGIAAVTTKEGSTFRVVTNQVVAVIDTPRFQVANVASKARVGPDILKGEDFAPVWEFTAADGERWYLTSTFTRVRAQDTAIVGVEPLKA